MLRTYSTTVTSGAVHESPSCRAAARASGALHRHAVEQARLLACRRSADHRGPPRLGRRRDTELDAPRAPRPLHAVVARAGDHDGDGPEHQ